MVISGQEISCLIAVVDAIGHISAPNNGGRINWPERLGQWVRTEDGKRKFYVFHKLLERLIEEPSFDVEVDLNRKEKQCTDQS